MSDRDDYTEYFPEEYNEDEEYTFDYKNNVDIPYEIKRYFIYMENLSVTFYYRFNLKIDYKLFIQKFLEKKINVTALNIPALILAQTCLGRDKNGKVVIIKENFDKIINNITIKTINALIHENLTDKRQIFLYDYDIIRYCRYIIERQLI